ncbi:MAG: phosphopantetheine-binding protein, partial [Oscillospiraceae bacterium]
MKEQVLALLIDICGEEGLREHPDTDLLESGLLDSLAFIELLDALEDTFGVELQPTQIPRESWRSVDSICT